MKPGNKQVLVAGVIAALVMGAGILFFAYSGSIIAAFANIRLAPQPTRFTELYFEHPNSLPSATTADQPLSFTFAIHNVEGATTTYPYRVYFEDPAGVRTAISSGVVTLADNAAAAVRISHAFKETGTKGTIVVELLSQQGQQIDFLLT